MFKTWVLNFWQIWLKLKPSFVNNPTTILLFPFVTNVVAFNVNAYKFFLTLKCRSLTCTIHNKCFEFMTSSTKHCLVEPVHGQTLPFMFLESVPLCLVKKELSLVFLLEERNDLNDNYPLMTYVQLSTNGIVHITSFSHKVSLKILWLQTGWGWEGAGAIGMNCCNSPCDPHDRTIVAPMSRPWSKHGLGRRASI